jgi:hypothetical protein
MDPAKSTTPKMGGFGGGLKTAAWINFRRRWRDPKPEQSNQDEGLAVVGERGPARDLGLPTVA